MLLLIYSDDVRASSSFNPIFFPSSFVVAPIATLRLGSTLNAESLKEGDDVYFECSIQANPDVTRLVWKHEVRYTHTHYFLQLRV